MPLLTRLPVKKPELVSGFRERGMPVHPPKKTALIPIMLTHPDGTTQTYWVSLERFMKERERGTKIRRIPRKKHKNLINPGEPAKDWEVEFIENIEDFGVAGLEFGENKFEAELVCEVRVKKNGELVNTYPIKVKREKVAREVLAKIVGIK